MDARLPASNFAGWGWGKSIKDSEMVIFNSDGGNSAASTYRALNDTDIEALPEQQQSCYTTSHTANDDGTVSISTSRPLDCGDGDSLELDKELEMTMAWYEQPALNHDKNY